MVTPAFVLTVENVPEKPHQPPASYIQVPKRTFGKKKPVSRSFQHPWFSQWPFLHYSEANEVAFGLHTMSTCLQAEEDF